jgi:hypothetical protein
MRGSRTLLAWERLLREGGVAPRIADNRAGVQLERVTNVIQPNAVGELRVRV